MIRLQNYQSFNLQTKQSRNASSVAKLSLAKAAWIVFAFCVLASTTVPAQTYTTLFAFGAGFSATSSPDGAWPWRMSLIQAGNGNLYGTTVAGGTNTSPNCFSNQAPGCGTVFVIGPGVDLTTLYSFCAQPDCADGASPEAGLVQGADGNFYGTTSQGGTNNDGTVFEIYPDGQFFNLKSFDGANGASPEGPLVQGTDGDFYGTTTSGGANNAGTAFKITPEGKLTTIYSFCSQTNCTDGANPIGGMLQANDGDFYGTTYGGGVNGFGTVFRVTSGGELTTLHSFNGRGDGNNPSAGLIQANDGNLYGTTSVGGLNSVALPSRSTRREGSSR